MNDKEMKVVFRMVDKVTADLEKIKGSMKGVEETAEKASKSAGKFSTALKAGAIAAKAVVAGLALAGVAVAGFGAVATKMGLDFQDATSKLIAGTGASSEALEGLQRVVRNVTKQVPQGLGEVADATQEINTRLGLVDKELETATKSFLDLSRVTGGDVQSSIKSVSRVMADWGIDATETTATLDKLLAASQSSGATIDQLTATTTNYGVQFRALGFSFDETVGLMAKFEKEGVSTEKMVSGLSIALGRMAQDGIDDTEVAFRELIKGMEDIDSVGEVTREAIELLGAKAGPDFALAVKEGRFAMEDYLEIIENAGGTLDDTAERTLTLGDRFGIFRNKVMDTLIPVGETITNVLVRGMEVAEEAFEGFIEGFDIDGVMEAFEGLKPLISEIGELFGITGQEYTTAFEQGENMGANFSDTLIRILEWVAENKDEIIEFATQVRDLAVAVIKFGIDAGVAIGNVIEWVKGIIEWWVTLNADIQAARQRVIDFVQGAIDKFVALINKFTEVANQIRGQLANLITVNGVPLPDYVRGVIRKVVAHFVGLAAPILQAGRNAADNFINPIKNLLATLPQKASEAITGILGKFAGLGGKILEKIGSINLPSLNIDLPKFARGGDFMTNGPQLLLVGDNPGGRERVSISPESGPLASSGGNGGGGGGGNITIQNVNISTNNPQEFMRKLDQLTQKRNQLTNFGMNPSL